METTIKYGAIGGDYVIDLETEPEDLCNCLLREAYDDQELAPIIDEINSNLTEDEPGTDRYILIQLATTYKREFGAPIYVYASPGVWR